MLDTQNIHYLVYSEKQSNPIFNKGTRAGVLRFTKKWYPQPITPLLNFLYTIIILNLCCPVSLVPTLCTSFCFHSTHHTRTHHGSHLFACSITCTYPLHNTISSTILYYILYITL